MDSRNQQSFDEALAIGGRVVLLAEDEPIVRNVVLAILQRQGFAVLVAVDGQEALDLARAYTGRISLLITNMVMPRMDGAELTMRLQAERPELIVIQMSGDMSDKITERNRGIPFLQKPFIPNTLKSKIDEVLNERPGKVTEI